MTLCRCAAPKRLLVSLQSALTTLRNVVEFTTRPDDPAREAMRFKTVLRPTFALTARGQKVASAVIRADVADDQQLALDVLLDCVDHLRAAARSMFSKSRPKLCADALRARRAVGDARGGAGQ